MKRTHRIVLTGGPGGGKTTAADLIRRELGEKVVVVPEAATMLFMGGFPRLKAPSLEAGKSAQKAIFHVQQNMEDVIHSLYPERVLLCDRGTIDGAAYWPESEEDFFSSMQTSLKEELGRYDAVIFFESAAVGNISIEMGNPIRTESNQQAVDLDTKLKTIWSQHPNYIHIKHQDSFIQKLQSAISALDKTLAKLNGNS